jgi:hypothetical protein
MTVAEVIAAHRRAAKYARIASCPVTVLPPVPCVMVCLSGVHQDRDAATSMSRFPGLGPVCWRPLDVP